MKAAKTKYVCQSCGYESPRWMGKCPECGAWNALEEEAVVPETKRPFGAARTVSASVPVTRIPDGSEQRIPTGIEEFDRVLGGGIVPGSVFLVGGVPGMGKSTLLLQVVAALAGKGRVALYVSAEESVAQVKMRAQRLGALSDRLHLLSETDVDAVAAAIRGEKPGLVVVDSVQTVYSPDLDGLPGNVSQVRYSGQVLTAAAKEEGIPLFLVGHVTKDGTLAGPRVLEHLVDGLLMLEGDGQHLYRLLRAVKNRFGSTNEVGLFEMTDRGLAEIRNPSEHLLAERKEEASGTAITVSLEGTRPLLVEVQALVTPTSYGIPQRTATGVDQRRLAIVLAVLEKRIGLKFGTMDVFLNVAGGLRLVEPASDLAVALSVVSSLRDQPMPAKTAVFGEIGLTGEIRGVSLAEKRIREAERLGFDKIFMPASGLKRLNGASGVSLVGLDTVREAVQKLIKPKGMP